MPCSPARSRRCGRSLRSTTCGKTWDAEKKNTIGQYMTMVMWVTSVVSNPGSQLNAPERGTRSVSPPNARALLHGPNRGRSRTCSPTPEIPQPPPRSTTALQPRTVTSPITRTWSSCGSWVGHGVRCRVVQVPRGRGLDPSKKAPSRGARRGAYGWYHK